MRPLLAGLTGMAITAVLAACGASVASSTALPPEPQPYLSPSPSPPATLLPPLTVVVLPTPTPVVYVVVEGDTLSGIAQRFGVSLEALIAANPGIQPTALSIGAKLTIPLGSATPGEATPTAVPVTLQQARCWPGTDGGLWCFALLHNPYAETLENMSVQFSLVKADGSQATSQIAYAPLDVLPSGESMPLAAYFPPPLAANLTPRVAVLTSLRLLPGDARYLPVALQDTLVSVDWSGRTAQVSGRAVLTAASGTVKLLWVLAVAYDAAGEVVGLRRWEAPSPLAAGASQDFAFSVSSIGPGIDHVEFLVEARP